MRVFIYEFVTGGGCYHVDPMYAPSGSLLAEGRAMVSAVSADFVKIDGVEVIQLWDDRLPSEQAISSVDRRYVKSLCQANEQFLIAVNDADYILLIAPEFDGHLLRLAKRVEEIGKPLLSPSSKFIALASDKWKTYLKLARSRNDRPMRTPPAWRLNRFEPIPQDCIFPLVAKPIDGCGSIGVQFLSDQHSALDWSELAGDAIVQSYVPGIAVSVAYIRGSTTCVILPACRQMLGERFEYQGGTCPLPRRLAERAYDLAFWVESRLPKSLGWFGFDLVLGEAKNGSQDYVIEVNPRLTTSYIGLREHFERNLAQAMLDAVQGGYILLMDPKPGSVEWTASGEVTYQP